VQIYPPGSAGSSLSSSLLTDWTIRLGPRRPLLEDARDSLPNRGGLAAGKYPSIDIVDKRDIGD